MKRFDDKLLIEVLETMRTPGGRAISEEAWQAIEKTEVERTGCDPRLRAARGWYESAYEWRIVSYTMHAQTRLTAYDTGKILFYIPAIDRPAVRCSKADFDEMLAEPNISKTRKFLGILPCYEGMEMILSDSVLPPKYVRGTPCVVTGLEPHPREPPIPGRDSILAEGCVLLRYMPKAIYVKVQGGAEGFLSTDADTNLSGILAITPQVRPWKFTRSSDSQAIAVNRTQIPLLPQKQCTLHGVQGKTADPGFIAHWALPPKLDLPSKWLATYVSLSRPRRFSSLLSHGLPKREVIEGGPPQQILEAFDELFETKIQETKVACANARSELKWPARGRA